MTLSEDGITLRDKAIFTGIIIILIVAIAILINQHYYESFRNTMIPVDFSIAFATPETDYDEALYQDWNELQRQLGNMINLSDNGQDVCHTEFLKSNATTPHH